MLAHPLGIVPGRTTQMTLRGVKLDQATGVYLPALRLSAPILKKEKAAVPNGLDANRVGDTQVVISVALPGEMAPGPVGVIIQTDAGTSNLHPLLVDLEGPPHAEKEPNGSFREAQPLTLGSTVEGRIDPPQDVDVYRIEGAAGQHLVAEVFAARHGSALDAVLYLYDTEGKLLLANDDADASGDARLEFRLPRAGRYFLCIQDAHDQGGTTHPYRLTVANAKP
jgi:hypothetical protein